MVQSTENASFRQGIELGQLRKVVEIIIIISILISFSEIKLTFFI